MPTKMSPAPLLPDSQLLDPTAPFDDESTRPVSRELIARLATQDPTVQLKISVVELLERFSLEKEEKEKKPGGEGR